MQPGLAAFSITTRACVHGVNEWQDMSLPHPLLITALIADALASMHVLAARLRFLDVAPRSRWLSFAGGVSVAYVFLHILPELSAHQATFAKGLDLGDKAAETWVYAVTLTGMVIFYGLERLAKTFRARGTSAVDRSAGFWLHIGSFAINNVLVGYLLLHREEAGLTSLLLYFVAMALHFLINDFGLREHHKAHYDHVGRWLLTAAPLVGWVLGATVTVSATAVGFLFAFLAGGVLLNVLKEELPEERKSRFGAFVTGVVAFAVLLVLAR